MRLRTRTRSDQVDDLFLGYLRLSEYRENVSSAKPMVTGYSSSCCRAEVRSLKNRDDYACIKCGRVCDTSSWHSPMAGTSSKGGWDPRPVWDSENRCWTSRQQTMYCNPTRVVNRHAHENKLVEGARRILYLKWLFDPRPRDMTKADWNRSKRIWQAWIETRDAHMVAMAMAHSARRECYTPIGVEHLIDRAREHVKDKLTRSKGRKRMPFEMVA